MKKQLKAVTKYELDEIVEHLQEEMSGEPNHEGQLEYWLHIDENGNLLPELSGAEMSFSALIDYEPNQDQDNWDWEEEGQPGYEEFLEVAKDLQEQVNEYLEDL